VNRSVLWRPFYPRSKSGPTRLHQPQRQLPVVDPFVTLDKGKIAAREQPHPFGVALDDQAIAVVLDFVDPLRSGTLAPLVGMQGSNGDLG